MLKRHSGELVIAQNCLSGSLDFVNRLDQLRLSPIISQGLSICVWNLCASQGEAIGYEFGERAGTIEENQRMLSFPLNLVPTGR